MRHVILGNGTAGVTAAETIRKHAPDDDILLLGAEPGPPYARSAIPHLLAGELQEAGTWLRKTADYFSRLRIELRTGRAVHLSTRTRTLKMEDGSVIPFDKLLIATGASARQPAVPGIELPGVHACWTLEDARRIMELATPRAQVILVGAGFIGCIVMEALAARGVDLTVIERRERMLPSMLCDGAARLVKQWCERKGIKVRTGTRVLAIGSGVEGQHARRMVRLSSGEQLPAALVVHCAGTVPNIAFLAGSGVKCLEGVVVDAAMQTNIDGIFAAGDCAETFDAETGRSIVAGVQPNAADQGYCAALNMVGKRAFQRGVRQIDVIDTMGLISSSFGQWQGVRGGQWVEVSDSRNFRYLRLEFSRDILVGCNMVGITEHAGILRTLIQHQIRLGEWKDKLLQDPSLIKEAYTASIEQHYLDRASVFHMPGAVPERTAHAAC